MQPATNSGWFANVSKHMDIIQINSEPGTSLQEDRHLVLGLFWPRGNNHKEGLPFPSRETERRKPDPFWYQGRKLYIICFKRSYSNILFKIIQTQNTIFLNIPLQIFLRKLHPILYQRKDLKLISSPFEKILFVILKINTVVIQISRQNYATSEQHNLHHIQNFNNSKPFELSKYKKRPNLDQKNSLGSTIVRKLK